jgi:hypothetical protein
MRRKRPCFFFLFRWATINHETVRYWNEVVLRKRHRFLAPRVTWPSVVGLAWGQRTGALFDITSQLPALTGLKTFVPRKYYGMNENSHRFIVSCSHSPFVATVAMRTDAINFLLVDDSFFSIKTKVTCQIKGYNSKTLQH